ncbi:hypothetical protein GQ53DRAFT_817817 [Thozetella sp. PMI_491]|nr:hypothetical protein GQ53DRAFT_817817 [Thozetella sp. PMI_491]
MHSFSIVAILAIAAPSVMAACPSGGLDTFGGYDLGCTFWQCINGARGNIVANCPVGSTCQNQYSTNCIDRAGNVFPATPRGGRFCTYILVYNLDSPKRLEDFPPPISDLQLSTKR